MVGESTRTVDYAAPAEVAYRRLQAAIARVGKLVDLNEPTFTVTCRTRYGLQRVRIRASVHRRDERSCTIDFQAFGDDIWGGGARRATDKLIAALGRS